MIDMSTPTLVDAPPLPALELGMQELEDLEAPGWGDIVSWVSGASVGGGVTVYISVATVAAT